LPVPQLEQIRGSKSIVRIAHALGGCVRCDDLDARCLTQYGVSPCGSTHPILEKQVLDHEASHQKEIRRPIQLARLFELA
jgi:hypothetical protein